MKNFWESKTLFIKRVLAAGGKSTAGFWGLTLMNLFIIIQMILYNVFGILPSLLLSKGGLK